MFGARWRNVRLVELQLMREVGGLLGQLAEEHRRVRRRRQREAQHHCEARPVGDALRLGIAAQPGQIGARERHARVGVAKVLPREVTRPLDQPPVRARHHHLLDLVVEGGGLEPLAGEQLGVHFGELILRHHHLGPRQRQDHILDGVGACGRLLRSHDVRLRQAVRPAVAALRRLAHAAVTALGTFGAVGTAGRFLSQRGAATRVQLARHRLDLGSGGRAARHRIGWQHEVAFDRRLAAVAAQALRRGVVPHPALQRVQVHRAQILRQPRERREHVGRAAVPQAFEKLPRYARPPRQQAQRGDGVLRAPEDAPRLELLCRVVLRRREEQPQRLGVVGA
mmetsp:Transcript_7802/g.24132  ORF Transcript_7802/g.24132 Transcript_7802/m.24132 type:complete len:338 (+) Transcript_7802:142-1155(+)